MALNEKQCIPCQGGVTPLTKQEAESYIKETPAWELGKDAAKIIRSWKFRNFKQALSFVNKVGEIAETQGHHPDITVGWGYCTVELQTHAIQGLHENDFIVAAKINDIDVE